MEGRSAVSPRPRATVKAAPCRIRTTRGLAPAARGVESGRREVDPDQPMRRAVAAASASGSPAAGQKTPAAVTSRSARGQHVVDPQVARPRPSSRQSAVSSAGSPSWPALAPSRPAAAPPRLVGRGSCRRGWARRRGDRLARAGAVERIEVEVAEEHQRPGGRGRLAARVVAERARRRDRRTRSRISSRLRRRLKPSAPSKSGGVGLAASRCSRAPPGRHRHVPVRARRQPAAPPAPPASGNGVPSVRTGSSAPGRSAQSSRRKVRAPAASIGSRDRIAMPPWPGNLPQPKRVVPAHRPPVAVEVVARGLAGVDRGVEAVRVVDAVRPLREQRGEGGERAAAQVVVEAGEEQDVGTDGADHRGDGGRASGRGRPGRAGAPRRRRGVRPTS